MKVEGWPYAEVTFSQQVAITIGELDRRLSELKLLALDSRLDQADYQTLKHHAEDCVGLGTRVLEILKERGV